MSSQEIIPHISPIIHETKPVEVLLDFPKRRSSLPITRKSPNKELSVTGESTPNFLYQSRPHTVKDMAKTSNNEKTNRKIKEFLRRFEKKTVTPEHPQVNKGLLGWKLKHLKPIKNQDKKLDYCRIFNVKKHSDLPFENLHSRRVHSTS